MCNSYFYDEEGRTNYVKFLESCAQKKVAIICDPPFGAKLELIIANIHQIQKDLRAATNCENAMRAKVILIHPYFSEGKILKIGPTLQMCDYKIVYGNHKKLGSNTSPVRIFTDVPLSKIIFPSSEVVADNEDAASSNREYKYCEICEKYVLTVSEHCSICNRCNSKDGKAYTHCYVCGDCVKKTWVHCHACGKCHFPEMQRCRNWKATLSSENKRKQMAKAAKNPVPKSETLKWQWEGKPFPKKKRKCQIERDAARRNAYLENIKKPGTAGTGTKKRTRRQERDIARAKAFNERMGRKQMEEHSTQNN